MKAHQEIYNYESNATYEKSSHRIQKLLEDDKLKELIEYYLARTYFKKKNGLSALRETKCFSS